MRKIIIHVHKRTCKYMCTEERTNFPSTSAHVKIVSSTHVLLTTYTSTCAKINIKRIVNTRRQGKVHVYKPISKISQLEEFDDDKKKKKCSMTQN